MKSIKRFSVIFLMLLVFACAFTLYACGESDAVSPIESVIVSTLPKTEYYLGDSFDLGDAKLTVTYENGKSDVILLDATMVSDFDSSVLGEQTLAIRYEDVTVNLVVTVSAPPVYSLAINSTEHKTEYVVGEDLSVKDLTMLVTYSNGTKRTIPVERDMVSGFDSASAGEKLVVVSYGNRTCTLPLTIVRKTIMQMQLRAPERLNYVVGDTVEFKGGSLFVSYNDNSEGSLDLVSLISEGAASVIVTNEESTLLTKKQAPCTVRIFYSGREFSYAIYVSELRATSAAITKEMDDQIMGSDAFDFSSGEVTVTFNNGRVSTLPFDDDAVELDSSACDINAVGKYRLTIVVGGMTLLYDVNVVAPSPVSLEIYPTKTEYYQGETIDITNWKYSVILNNGKKQRVDGTADTFVVTEEMCLDDPAKIDNYKVGTAVFRFAMRATTGAELKTQKEIAIVAKTITGFSMVDVGKTVYSEGDAFLVADTRFTVTYNNGDVSGLISLTPEMLRGKDDAAFDEEDLLGSAGEEGLARKTIYVRYDDPTFDTSTTGSFSVLLVRKASAIELLGSPRSEYVLGNEFDPSDWQIKITFSNSTTTTVSGETGGLNGEEWSFVFERINGTMTVTATAFDQTGRYNVILTYGSDVSLTYPVSVTNDISDITVSAVHLGFVTEGTEPDLSDYALYITRENGDKETVALSSGMIGDYYATAYKPSDAVYVSAYVDAVKLAASIYERNEWEERFGEFYVVTDAGYAKATAEYNVESEYRVNIAERYADVWDRVKSNFYVDEIGTKAGDYVEGLEYYINNTGKLTVRYLTKSTDVYVSVAGKVIVSAAVQAQKTEYVKTETDWDTGSLELLVQYSNGTSALISGRGEAGKTELHADQNALYYAMGDLRYDVEIGILQDGTFVPYGFSEFKAGLESGADKMVSADLVYRVTDAINGEYAYTDGADAYCFDRLIYGINVLIGDYDGTTFTAYDDQSLYVNEGKRLVAADGGVLSSEGFVKANDDSRESVVSHVYLRVRGEDEDEYITLQEALNASASSFYISEYSQSTVHQILTVGYLRKQSSIGLEIRPNVVNYLTVSVPDGGLSVIEKTAIDPDDVVIRVGYKDADGVTLTYEDENGIEQRYLKKIDFRQAICEGYSKTMDWDFGEENSVVVALRIGYGDYAERADVDLTVKRKDLVSITLTSMPQLEYVEDPTGNTKISYVGGKVSLRFDNGTTKILDLTDGSLRKNAGTFDTEVQEELTGGAQKQHTVYVSYNYAYYNNTQQTSYNVIILDRKYVRIAYDETLGYDKTLVCEYGASEARFVLPRVTYYTGTTADSGEYLENGAKDTVGEYFIQYRYPSGELKTTWPKAVGTYTVRITYFENTGDAYNNPFVDESVTIQVTKKALGIAIDAVSVVYGTILEGDNEGVLADFIPWRMTDSVGLPENAFCEGDDNDDAIEWIKLYVYGADNVRILLTEYTYQATTVCAVTLPVGQYTIKPMVKFISGSNYTAAASLYETKTTLTVAKRGIVIAADAATKVYGSPDPSYSFRVYNASDVCEAFGVTDLTGITSEAIHAKEASGLTPIGNKNAVYYTYGGTNYLGNGAFNVNSDTIVYADVSTMGYHLTRDSSDHANVGNDHPIYSGAASILTDYEVSYIGNVLTITKADLLLTAHALRKYFGTVEFDYSRAETDRKDQMDVYADPSTPIFGADSYDELFGGYFEDAGYVFFYDAETNTYTNEVAGFCDTWVKLYKNIRIYTDASCTVPLGAYAYHEIDFAGERYTGYYTALPIRQTVGTYYVVPDVSGAVLTNYSVSVKPYSAEAAYCFTLQILPVVAKINVRSYVISGDSMIRDQKNNSLEGKLLPAYFAGENIVVESVNKSTFDASVDTRFKNGITAIEYYGEAGVSIEYRLSYDIINATYSFVREAGDLDVGIHKVTIDNQGDEFDIRLTSLYADSMWDAGITYVRMFHDAWSRSYYSSGSEYSIDAIDDDEYASDAYVVVVPEFFSLSYGDSMTVENNEYSFALESTYRKATLRSFGLNSYVSTNGLTYTLYEDTDGISFAAVNNDSRYEYETIMVAGEYTGTIKYSYFDTSTKNYVFLGDSMLLRSEDMIHIINYIFNEAYMENAVNKPLVFSETFTYTVDKIGLGVKVETESCKYDEDVERTVRITLEEGKGTVCPNDELNLTFNVDVTYNEKSKQSFTGVELGSYSVVGTTKNGSIGAVSVSNAGVYDIRVTDLGNENYEIIDDENGWHSFAGTFEVIPLVVPIYVQTKTGYNEETPTVFTLDYTAGGDAAEKLIDTTWRESTDNKYSYRTTSCYILKTYYSSYNTATHTPVGQLSAELNFLPKNLVISTAQPNDEGGWVYPKNVRRDADGNVIGYPITYRVVNTDYVNYTVVFVYKVVYNYSEYYVEFAEGEGYELVIKPKTVSLYGFDRLNSKTYDGTPASVRSSDSALTFLHDLPSDRIVRSGVSFEFIRTEESKKIGNFTYITDENITDAGVFRVRVKYVDTLGNQNYEIVFAEEAQYNDGSGKDPSVGVYTISRGTAVLDLKHYSKPWMYKEYDGLSFINANGYTGTAETLTFSAQDAKPIDSFSSIFYKIVVTSYAAPSVFSVANYSGNPISYLDVADNGLIGDKQAIPDPATFTYNVGYYWFTLRGMYSYVDQETGTTMYAEFTDGTNRVNWLSWNYEFEVKEPLLSTIEYGTSDGIFFIYPRNIYLCVNYEEDETSGVLNADAMGTTNMLSNVSTALYPLSTGTDTYVYAITYDGFTYKRGVGVSAANKANGIFYSGSNYDLEEDLNAGNTTGRFSYAFYVYDADMDVFVNMNRFEAMSSAFALPASPFAFGANSILTTGSYLSASVSAITDANKNFNIINAGSNRLIRFRVAPRVINLKLTLTEVEGTTLKDAQMVYGTTYAEQDGLVFRFENEDGEYDNQGAIDPNLLTFSAVVNNIVNASRSGYVNLVDMMDGERRVLSDLTPRNVTTKAIDGMNLVFLTGSSVASLAANPYDDGNHILERYSTVGVGLSNDETRYQVHVTGTYFHITRKEIYLTGIERAYFDKDTDHYVFTIRHDDAFTQDDANEVLDADYDGDGYILKDYIEDQTKISDNKGDWSSDKYYAVIDSGRFRSDNPNYVVKTLTENGLFDFNSWDGQSVDQKTFVYMPVTIRKAVVTINYYVDNDVAYGDLIETSDGGVNYAQEISGLPHLQNATHTYTYINHAKGTIVTETDIEYTGKERDGIPISIQDEQEELKDSVSSVMLFANIRTMIAQTNVTGDQSVVAFTSRYYSDTPILDNYEIRWGNIYFTIVKKSAIINMSVSNKAYYVNGTQYSYFSARWSERNDFYYAGDIEHADEETQRKDRRLGYTIKINGDEPILLNGVACDTLEKKLAAILGLSYTEDNGVWTVTYNHQDYHTTYDFLKAVLEYSIYVNRYATLEEDPLATSGEKLRYIAISGLESQNFSINCVRTEIMLYPEIQGIGLYVKDSSAETLEYADMIADTEASKDGVTVQRVGDEYVVNGLSTRIRYNFIGRATEDSVEYVDTKATSTADYTGMTYNRVILVRYLPELSATNLIGEGGTIASLQNGDTITVQIVITERFYQGMSYEYVNTIETNCFTIKMMEEGNATKGYVSVVADKTSNETLRRSTDSELKDVGTYLNDTAGTYYLDVWSEEAGQYVDLEGMYDILQMRVKLVPMAAGAGERKFEIVVYQNDFGTLTLGFTGTEAYTTMRYNSYFIAASNNYDADAASMPIDPTATYYRFTLATSLTEGDPVGEYYEVLGNGYILTSDSVVATGKNYYLKTAATGLGSDISATASELFVNFSKNTIVLSDTCLFDGGNHTFGVYLDKVGSFTNISYVPVYNTWTGEDDGIGEMNGLNITADRVYSLRVRVDESDYLFTFIGEPYTYEHSRTTYTLDGVTTPQNEVYDLYTTRFFTTKGNTAISFRGLRVNVNKYSVQNRLISTATTSKYIANVLFWPAVDTDEIPYITNAKTAQALVNALASVGNVTISGGSDALEAYTIRFNDEVSVVSTTRNDTDITNSQTNASILPGLYTITYVSRYNYMQDGASNSYDLSEKTIRVLSSSAQKQGVSLRNEAESAVEISETVQLSSGYYFTGDLRTDMYGNSSLTYVFDNVTIDSGGDVYFYFKLSNTAYRNLLTKYENMNDVSGIALKLGRSGGYITAQVLLSRQTPAEDDSQYICWYGEEKIISFASGVINILKIDVTRVSSNAETGSAIPYLTENDVSIRMYNDVVVSFRLYQHSATGTSLVFEDYIRDGFGTSLGDVIGGAIERNELEKTFFATGLPHYVGLGLVNASFRLIDMYIGDAVVTKGDFVRYDQSSADVSGVYVDNDSDVVYTGTQSIYLMTDCYDVPYAYQGNTINIRFKADGTNGGFRFYFGMNTPYYTDFDELDERRQRGLYLEYDSSQNELRMYFYKYNAIYLYQTVAESVSLLDGKEHTITVLIDFSQVATQSTYSNKLREYYAARTFLGSWEGSEYVVTECDGFCVPVSNNMTGLQQMYSNQNEDNEQNKDYMFMRGTYYLGFGVFGDANLRIYDYIGFQTDYSI